VTTANTGDFLRLLPVILRKMTTIQFKCLEEQRALNRLLRISAGKPFVVAPNNSHEEVCL